MSTDSVKGWSIIVSGRTLAELAPGDSVVIGRKPLRPLPDEEVPRVDVADPTKSMSKRHALFSVLMDGQGVLRDLNSTNGTFVVRDNGDLSRMPFGQDFTFSRSPMHLQLGDMAIEFRRTDVSAMPQDAIDPPVQSLFSYAPMETEPPVAQAGQELSVDDILDLRTGEPTSAFQAMPKHKRQELPPTFPPMSIPSKQLGSQPDQWPAIADPVVAAASRTASADQPAPTASSDADSSAGTHDAGHAMRTDGAAATREAAGGNRTASPVRAPALPSPAQSLHLQPEPLPKRDLFQDALERRREEEAARAEREAAEREARAAEQAEREAAAQAAATRNASAFAWEDDPFDATGTGGDDLSEGTEADAAAPADPAADGAAAAYRPVFEPGSVFERLSRGEFERKEPAVVVDGMTSDDARTTTDYNMQFEMARKRPLLPFLALNPHLYHKLYEFLESLDDPDIDAGLEDNDGYAEYKKGSSR